MSNRKSFMSDEFIAEPYARKVGSSFQNKPSEFLKKTKNNRVSESESPANS